MISATPIAHSTTVVQPITAMSGAVQDADAEHRQESVQVILANLQKLADRYHPTWTMPENLAPQNFYAPSTFRNIAPAMMVTMYSAGNPKLGFDEADVCEALDLLHISQDDWDLSRKVPQHLHNYTQTLWDCFP